jgi:hypothetical protein
MCAFHINDTTTNTSCFEDDTTSTSCSSKTIFIINVEISTNRLTRTSRKIGLEDSGRYEFFLFGFFGGSLYENSKQTKRHTSIAHEKPKI